MKKLLTILSITSLIFLASCGKKIEENNNTNEENKIENETNIDSSDLENEEINIDDIYEFWNNDDTNSSQNQWDNTGTVVNVENNTSIEIEDEISEMTEEEILRDIDALINDIINSTTND